MLKTKPPTKYRVTEIFNSLQGEGFHSGRPAIFVRFQGCNLRCSWCDTAKSISKQVPCDKYTQSELINEIKKKTEHGNRFIVFTGGEPTLQLNRRLVSRLRTEGYQIAVETNGTIKLDFKVDWLTVSPKPTGPFRQTEGDELKVVYPDADHKLLSRYLNYSFTHYYISPMWNDDYEQNLEKAIEYCIENPPWKLSLQIHKIIGVD